MWNLIYLWEDVVYVGPGWTLKGSSCVLDEEGVAFRKVNFDIYLCPAREFKCLERDLTVLQSSENEV